MMIAPDLHVGPPPRWSDATTGIVWLPRMAAKVRAYDAGTLGTYLLGQSPVDDEFLRVARSSYAAFVAVVRASADDEAILAALEAASPGSVERLRLWSMEMPVRRRLHMRVLDADDGYDRPKWFAAIAPAANVLVGPLMKLARKVRPLRA